MHKARCCFVSMMLALGIAILGAHMAYANEIEVAEDPNETETLITEEVPAPGGDAVVEVEPQEATNEDEGVTPQDGEKNYAVFDTGTNTLTFHYGVPQVTDYYEGYDMTVYAKDGDRPWYATKNSIVHVVFDSSVSGHLKPKSTAWWFTQFYNLEDVTGMEYLDTSDVTTMAQMFYDCRKITTVNLSTCNTANVWNMAGLFSSCNNLSNLTLGNRFTTESVEDMSSMFSGCSSLTSLDLSSFNTANVTTMNHMFSGCSGLSSLNLSSFNTSNVTDMAYLFSSCKELADCGTALQLGQYFNTSKVTTMEGMFESCEKMQTVALPTAFSTANVTNMHRMFYQCKALTNDGFATVVARFDTAKVTFFSSMFQGCTSLTNIQVPFNTQSAEDKPTTGNERSFGCMFLGCSNLESIMLGDDFVVNKQTKFDRVFESCVKLRQAPDLSKCITSKVTSLYNTFYDCKALTSVDLSGLDLSGVEKTEGMFAKCTELASAKFGALNSGTLKYMQSMFSGCSKLTSVDFASLATGSCNMSKMFYNCAALTALDLSNWDTTSANNLTNMFDGCSKLSSVTLGETFSFRGTISEGLSGTWALLPKPSNTASYNGLWWKGPGTTSYTNYTMRGLAGADLAGTWTWSQGVAVVFVSSEGGTAGATSPNTGNTGDTVTIKATPKSGYEFDKWELKSGYGTFASTTDNPTTFTLGTDNGTVRAVFKPVETYTYTIGSLSQTSYAYDGKAHKPTVVVRDGTSNTVLEAGTHYTLTYEKDGVVVNEPIEVGTYTAYVTGAGAYATMPKSSAGTFVIKSSSPVIKPSDPVRVNPTISLSATSYTWDGGVKTPAITVKVGSKTLVNGTDYTATYVGNRKDVGTYQVTVACKGNYAFDTNTLSFVINPKGTTAKKPAAASKALTVKWSKQAKKMSSSTISGYEIQVATNKAFTKNVKKVTVKGLKTTSKKIKKLKAKKAYYVRVRTYKKVGNTTYYSGWSTYKKAVKTK